MKSILIIGLGRFGQHLCRKMVELKNEVMVIDVKEENVEAVVPMVTSAQIGDCTNVEVLKSIGVANFDVCFVCIGNNFQNSLEVTSLVKEMGAKYVVSRAVRDIHAKFLLRNGADEVIHPDSDIAERVAKRFSRRSIFDYIELNKEYSIYEIPPFEECIGKTIKESNFREKYDANILGIKETAESPMIMPTSDHVFLANEHVVIFGKRKMLDKYIK